MLTVRKKQLAALEDEFQRRHGDRIEKILAGVFPQKAEQLGETGLAAAVKEGVARAREHGFDRPENIERYIHLLFLLDVPDLGATPETEWALDILDWPNAEEDLKIAALEKRVRDDQIRALVK